MNGLDERNDWKEFALEGSVKEVVIEPITFDFTRRVSLECSGDQRPEQGGYFGGFLNEGVFYVMQPNMLGMGGSGRLQFGNPSRDQTRLTKKAGELMPGYRTLMFHSHPKVTEKILLDSDPISGRETVEKYKQDITNGDFDFLRDYGVEPTLEAVLNESLSRGLSPMDVDETIGDYHLLISPTVYPKSRYAHLNAYHLDGHRLPDYLISGREMNKADGQKVKPLIREFRKIQRAVKKEVWGFVNLQACTTNYARNVDRAREVMAEIQLESL